MLRSKNSSGRARAASTSSRSSPSSRGRGRGASNSSSTTSNANPSNPFEGERLENAAKREQKGQESASVSSRGTRGSGRGRYQSKTVRFTSPPTQPPRVSSLVDSSVSMVANGTPSSFSNPNIKTSTTDATSAPAQLNPFGAASIATGASPYSTATNGTGWNPFSSPSPFKAVQENPISATKITKETKQSGVFGSPSGLNSNLSTQNPFNRPLLPPTAKASIFGTTKNPLLPSSTSSAILFTTNKGSFTSNESSSLLIGASNPPNLPKDQSKNEALQAGFSPAFPTALNQFNMFKNNLGTEIDVLLRKHGIIAPPWPTNPGDPSQKAAVEAFWQSNKAYRTRVRTCLIQCGFLDDPEKPKKLSEAIDFKGTCEEMCPQFEKVTRIVEHDVQMAEKELSPDGQTYWPALHKMVKALARSAAGQDAPLPEDVRSPAALRRTLDYLIDTVLATNDLPAIHGFLWDRTRAIRRDFVFQQSSMSSQELLDQVYCLEQITRFHVVALHQMSHEDVIAEDFSEQQEIEQLGKALLSLIHAYEDSKTQGIRCENEPEFRAYYVLFNSHNTGILEAVQDWGWSYWSGSDDICTAVSLVETLQNIWDTQGPLNPHSATEVAQNAFYRFFSIVKNTKVSYIMACFAEIHFNKVRKAALKTILSSYRKQRDQTTDWTLERLYAYLYFDDKNDVVTFGEAYGVHFDILNGQECLLFESDDSMKDPFPQLKQSHSYRLVEKKRGDHTLPDVIHRTIFDETIDQITEDNDDDNSLFVPRRSNSTVHEQPGQPHSPDTDTYLNLPTDTSIFPDPDKNTSKLLFREEQTNAQIEKGGDLLETKPVSFSSPGMIAPATIIRAGDSSMSGGKIADSGSNKPLENISTFNDKTAQPPLEIFSFLDKAKTAPSIQNFSHNTSIPPPVTSTQNMNPSKLSWPISKPAFSFLESSGSITSSKVQPSFSMSTTGTAQSGHASNFAKDGAHVQIKPKLVDKNLEESKQLLLDRSVSRQSVSPVSQVSNAGPPKKSRMASFTQWIALGQDGLVDQFVELTVENILTETVKKFIADEKKRRLHEEEKQSRGAAANYRFKFLATKYFYAWRNVAHQLWMRRKGRLARQARRQMAEESFRASRASEKRDIVEEFRAFGDTKRQNAAQNLTSTEDLSPLITPADDIRTGLKKSGRFTDVVRLKPSRQEQTTVDYALRKSLLSEAAYLQGGSRIHLINNYKPQVNDRRQPNGVKTDYFRLKARGIMTLPDGTPLANTAAVHLNHQRSLEDISKPTMPDWHIGEAAANSVPSKPAADDALHVSTDAELIRDIDALKATARAVMAKDNEEKQSKKRILDDDEIELFASAKRVREQMDEETLWMREQILKSKSRSSS